MHPLHCSARTLLFQLAMLFFFSGGAVWAQQQSTIAPGTRIRVAAPDMASRRLTGKLFAAGPDTLVLSQGRRGPHMWIPLASVTTLEISRGQSGSRADAALAGAGYGLIGALALGFLCVKICVLDAGSGANMAPIGALFVGPPLGALLGAFLLVPERWERVPLAVEAQSADDADDNFPPPSSP